MNFDHVREVGTNIRVHGNGFLQVDMPRGARVHLFGHPSIPRQVTPTPVHDHRWSLTSEVLCGTLINVVWQFAKDNRNPHTHFVCGYTASEVGGEDTRLIPTTETGYLVLYDMACVKAGGQYSHPRNWLHETFANEPTITHMTKKFSFDCDDIPDPRVLCRIGRDPDNRFSRYGYGYGFGESDLWEILRDSFDWVQDRG